MSAANANRRLGLLCALALALNGARSESASSNETMCRERQVTKGVQGRILTNVGVWSPDAEWIVYDTRPDPAGEVFEGDTIERVHVVSGAVEVLYRSRQGAHCGVATVNPVDGRVVFILGPEHPDASWAYGPTRRRGVVVDPRRPGVARPLDARNLVAPFTAGALRGGSHVHVWEAAGDWLSFTYEDEVLSRFQATGPDHDVNLRNVGVSVPLRPVQVPASHSRNHDGDWFSVVVTRTTATPRPGSDEINRAFEEGWVGTHGYVRADGSRQRRALAFQGRVVPREGAPMAEVFIVDLPEALDLPGEGPLEGTETRMPQPPRGTVQRRLTFTSERRYPGIQGPRHWLRASPDGSQIAFLVRDDDGVVQLATVSPNGGPVRILTRNRTSVASAFTWSPDGSGIAHVMDNSVCVTAWPGGETRRLTPRTLDLTAPRPEACVFSPDGRKIAFVRRIPESGRSSNQICVVSLDEPAVSATAYGGSDPAPR